MRIEQMSNEQLVENIITWAYHEAQIIPTANGRGNKKRKELLDKIERGKQELLKRLNKSTSEVG